MLAKTALDMRKQLMSEGVFFAYCGYMNESLLAGLGDALRRKLGVDEPDVGKSRSAFSVFVEQMQNIMRHSSEQFDADAAEPLRFGMLNISRSGGDYIVTSANKVRREEVPRLRSRLEEIRAMDRQGIMAAYRKQLLANEDTLLPGAGIGFLEVARRASQPVDFDFVNAGDDDVFFAFKVTV